MTVLFDATIQHTGWSTGVFATGGWVDRIPPLITGLPAVSWWAHSLNGLAIDQALNFNSRQPSGDYWVNVHTNAVLTGLTKPSPYVVPPGESVYVYTRPPRNSDVLLFRFTVTDQGSTPPPTTPP